MLLDRDRIRELRTARGWTQQQLADVTGLSLRTIQRVELQGNASMETLNALCATLEVERQALNTPVRKGRPLALYLAGFFVLGTLTGVGITLLVV